IVPKTIEECKHHINTRCDLAPKRTDCVDLCSKILACGHLCTNKCSILNCGNCEFIIDVPAICRHNALVQVKCSDNVWHYQSSCKRPCYQNLKCGHICENSCSDCYGGYIHSVCSKNLEMSFSCGHKKLSKCYEKQPICLDECKNECPHGKCTNPCGWLCTACNQPCKYKCEHFACTKECWDICDRPMCDQNCPRKLPCGHQCIGICGEPCPTICQFCNQSDFAKISPNSGPESKFVLLTDCGHVFESIYLDNYIREKSFQFIQKSTGCPLCHAPIRHNYRYGNFLKAEKMELDRVKYSQIGNMRGNELSKFALLEKIEKNKNSFGQIIKNQFILEITQIDYLTQSTIEAYSSTWDLFLQLDSLNE
ncbi:NFX1-type zinc finger-containing 1, partial [Brachionus plicatilis]